MTGHEALALDAANVYPKLWVGSHPPVDRRLPAFSLVVLCAAELQPERVGWEGRVIRVAIPDDALDRNEIRRAVVGARGAADELTKGGRVLVTCAAGRNRSALVAVMAMLMRAPTMTPGAAIEQIREKRHPQCLYNRHFVQILHQIWKDRDRRAG